MPREPRWPAVVAVILVLVGGGLLAFAGTPVPRRHTVEIRGMAFHPAELEVAVGDTVVWFNRDVFPHTATTLTADGWDTGMIDAGKEGRVVVDRSGSASYQCDLHPSMKGTLLVR